MSNKLNKSGMDAKKFKKEVEELKPGDGVTFDDGTKYEYGADLNTETPLIDPGEGGSNVIRQFMFKMNPETRRNFPDRQALFNAHAKQITTILWGDGLRPLEEFSPRVIIDMKRGIYKIFVPCKSAKGVIFSEKDRNPELLHKQLSKKVSR